MKDLTIIQHSGVTIRCYAQVFTFELQPGYCSPFMEALSYLDLIDSQLSDVPTTSSLFPQLIEHIATLARKINLNIALSPSSHASATDDHSAAGPLSQQSKGIDKAPVQCHIAWLETPVNVKAALRSILFYWCGYLSILSHRPSRAYVYFQAIDALPPILNVRFMPVFHDLSTAFDTDSDSESDSDSDSDIHFNTNHDAFNTNVSPPKTQTLPLISPAQAITFLDKISDTALEYMFKHFWHTFYFSEIFDHAESILDQTHLAKIIRINQRLQALSHTQDNTAHLSLPNPSIPVTAITARSQNNFAANGAEFWVKQTPSELSHMLAAHPASIETIKQYPNLIEQISSHQTATNAFFRAGCEADTSAGTMSFDVWLQSQPQATQNALMSALTIDALLALIHDYALRPVPNTTVSRESSSSSSSSSAAAAASEHEAPGAALPAEIHPLIHYFLQQPQIIRFIQDNLDFIYTHVTNYPVAVKIFLDQDNLLQQTDLNIYSVLTHSSLTKANAKKLKALCTQPLGLGDILNYAKIIGDEAWPEVIAWINNKQLDHLHAVYELNKNTYSDFTHFIDALQTLTNTAPKCQQALVVFLADTYRAKEKTCSLADMMRACIQKCDYQLFSYCYVYQRDLLKNTEQFTHIQSLWATSRKALFDWAKNQSLKLYEAGKKASADKYIALSKDITEETYQALCKNIQSAKNHDQNPSTHSLCQYLSLTPIALIDLLYAHLENTYNGQFFNWLSTQSIITTFKLLTEDNAYASKQLAQFYRMKADSTKNQNQAKKHACEAAAYDVKSIKLQFIDNSKIDALAEADAFASSINQLRAHCLALLVFAQKYHVVAETFSAFIFLGMSQAILANRFSPQEHRFASSSQPAFDKDACTQLINAHDTHLEIFNDVYFYIQHFMRTNPSIDDAARKWFAESIIPFHARMNKLSAPVVIHDQAVQDSSLFNL